jgi:hypothetical protein
MKKFAFLTAGLAASLFLAACDCCEKQNTASAGAMSDKPACCSAEKKCDAKCTGDVKTCSKTDCCQKKCDKAAAPGAVSDKKEGCCSATKTSAKADGCAATCPATKAEAKTCPMTGETKKDASMGAVGEKKEGCCKSQSSCSKQG